MCVQRSALAGDSTVFSGPASSRGTESGAQLANAPDPFEAAASRGALADTGAKAPPAAAVLAANASEQHASEDTVMRDAEATAAADTPLSAAADRTELSGAALLCRLHSITCARTMLHLLLSGRVCGLCCCPYQPRARH